MLALLAGCSSAREKPQLLVIPHGPQTYFLLSVPTARIEFNWHSGTWNNVVERYRVAVPTERELASAAEITVTQEVSGDPVPIGANSSVKRSHCEVSFSLTEPSGTPFWFNGSYKVSRGACPK